MISRASVRGWDVQSGGADACALGEAKPTRWTCMLLACYGCCCWLSLALVLPSQELLTLWRATSRLPTDVPTAEITSVAVGLSRAALIELYTGVDVSGRRGPGPWTDFGGVCNCMGQRRCVGRRRGRLRQFRHYFVSMFFADPLSYGCSVQKIAHVPLA